MAQPATPILALTCTSLTIDRRVAGAAGELHKQVGVGPASFWWRGGGERERCGERRSMASLRHLWLPERLRDGAGGCPRSACFASVLLTASSSRSRDPSPSAARGGLRASIRGPRAASRTTEAHKSIYRGRSASSCRSLAAIAAMPAAQYPMHVLPVARLLQLQRLPTHEEIKHELVEQRDGMHTVFVSQTWLSRAHPDNVDNAKLKLLQSFLRDASDGKKGVRPSLLCEIFWGGRLKIPARALRKIQYVWLDVFSIPQADRERQGEAIASIPNYVERAAFFVCVAGPVASRERRAPRRACLVRARVVSDGAAMQSAFARGQAFDRPAIAVRRTVSWASRPIRPQLDHKSRGPRRIYGGGGSCCPRPRHRALNRRADGGEAGGGHRGRAAMVPFPPRAQGLVTSRHRHQSNAVRHSRVLAGAFGLLRLRHATATAGARCRMPCSRGEPTWSLRCSTLARTRRAPSDATTPPSS